MSESRFQVDYARVNEKIVKATLTPTGESTVKNCSTPMFVVDLSGSMAGSRERHCYGALQELLKRGPIRLITYNNSATNYGVVAALPRLSANGGTSFCAAWDEVLRSRYAGPVVFMTDGEDQSGFSSKRTQYMSQLPPQVQIFCVGIESQSNTQALLDLCKSGPLPGEYTFFSSSMNNYAQEADWLARQVFSEPITFRGQQYHLGSEPLQIYLEDSQLQCQQSGSAAIDYLGFRADQLVKLGQQAELSAVQALRDEADRAFRDASGLPRTERKIQRTRLQPVHQLISKFYELRHSGQRIDHETLAKLALCARDARSNRFAKIAVDRAERNLPLLKEQDELLEQLAAKGRPSAGQEQCAISCLSVDEILSDADCLGIGLQCDAREACIADPTLLSVREVGSSYLACGNFLEASEWASDQFGVSFKAPTQVMADASRVQVNAVLPLFLNETHWEFAKHYVMRMAAHACCKDPVQGSNRHTFYTYLLAWRACTKKQGEFYAKLAADLQEVLKRLPLMVPRPDTFCTSIGSRMPDSVPSLKLLKLAYRALELQVAPEFPLLVAEEQLRREQHAEPLLLIPNELVTPFVNANKPLSNSVGAMLAASLASTHPKASKMMLDALEAKAGRQRAQGPKVEVPVAQAFSAKPLKQILAGISPERSALMALQAWKYGNATECTEHYQPYWQWQEADIQSKWHEHCVEQLELKRKAALTAELGQIHSDTLGSDLQRLKTCLTESKSHLLFWVATLHRNCYVGRNITEYARLANSFEHIRMICSGQYDIAPLINLPGPIIVSTVHDIDKVNNCLRVPYAGRWIPSCQRKSDGRLFRQWRNQYGVRLLEVMPETGPNMALRHWQALLQQCDPEQLRNIIQTAHGAQEIWRQIIALLQLPIPHEHVPTELASLFPKKITA